MEVCGLTQDILLAGGAGLVGSCPICNHAVAHHINLALQATNFIATQQNTISNMQAQIIDMQTQNELLYNQIYALRAEKQDLVNKNLSKPKLNTATESEILQPHVIANITIDRVLGMGSSSTVYLANDTTNNANNRVVVKVHKNINNAVRERAALQHLNTAGVQNVPTFVREATTAAGQAVTVSFPDGTPVTLSSEGRRLRQSHLLALIDIVQGMHDAGVIHRDIKPDNLFLTAEDKLFLNDFGAALREGMGTAQWIGTRVYSPAPPVLYDLDPPQRPHVPTRTEDFRSLVRTLFVLVTLAQPVGNVLGDFEFYWQQAMPPGSVWHDMYAAADTLNYQLLRDEIVRIVGHAV